MSVSACILVRDDASTCERLFQQLRPHVDELVIVDTGSTDETPQIAQQYADKFAVYTGCNEADGRIRDFADARNHALSLATHPWHFWADADDEVTGAEHIRELAAQRKADNQIYLIPYNYTFDGSGNVTCVHWRENLVYPRDRYKWQSPCHEVLLNSNPLGSCHFERTQLVRRIHRKSESRRPQEPDRNLRILRAHVARVGESDVRAWYYLGVELSMRGHVGEAMRVLRRYTQLSGWGDEKCLAYLQLAQIQLDMIKDYESAIEWALKAMLTKSWDAPYWVISKAYGQLAFNGIAPEENWRKCAHFADIGFKLPETDTVLFVNPMERLEMYGVLTHARAAIGDIQGAYNVASEGLGKLPGDPWLMQATKTLDSILTQNRVLGDLTKLHGLGALTTDFMQHIQVGFARAHQALLPPAPPPVVHAIPEQIEKPAPEPQPAAAGCLDIALFVGPGLELWNPDTLRAKGMGGSETMAWEMSKRLRALGHRVRVFVQCGAELEGIFDGVEWLDWSRYRGTTCDVLIASRYPVAVDDEADVHARARVLWLHDVHAGEALTQRRALRFDAIWCLSEWHADYVRSVYPRMNPALVQVTRNGIDLSRFEWPTEAADEDGNSYIPIFLRHKKRIIYSSSPDRGLATLIDLWPRIIAEEPEAQLSVFYGWANLLKTLEMRGDPAGYSEAVAFRDRVAATPGVTVHGMVSGDALAGEMLSSGVWAYPTWFSETSCIGAMEAQAAGLYCVATPVAALNETIADRGTLVPGIVEHPGVEQPEEFKAAFVHAVVDALRGLNQPCSREELQRYAREHFSLDALAKDWDVMLREIVGWVDMDVVGKFWSAA